MKELDTIALLNFVIVAISCLSSRDNKRSAESDIVCIHSKENVLAPDNIKGLL